jgi:hypothetical protein
MTIIKSLTFGFDNSVFDLGQRMGGRNMESLPWIDDRIC